MIKLQDWKCDGMGRTGYHQQYKRWTDRCQFWNRYIDWLFVSYLDVLGLASFQIFVSTLVLSISHSTKICPRHLVVHNIPSLFSYTPFCGDSILKSKNTFLNFGYFVNLEVLNNIWKTKLTKSYVLLRNL